MTEATIAPLISKDDPSPSHVNSSPTSNPMEFQVPEPEATKSTTSALAAAVSSTLQVAGPSNAVVAAAIAPPAVVTGSSRAAKSKKKKGGGRGGESAGENTGRWTAEEHRLFLQGLEQHGKGWKKIASLIKSRTVVQIRTHAQKYFQKLAKARQNGEEGEISMEGRGGISTITSASATIGGMSPKRRRQQTGTKRKVIHSVVASAQREGKRMAMEQENITGVPNPIPPLPAVSTVLANFLVPEMAGNTTDTALGKSTLGSSTTTSQGTVSGPALEDSIFRFLTPTPILGEANLNDVARQAGANPITLPTEQPSAAPTVGGEISPTGVADLSLYPSWSDGKDAPSWYAKGADVEALLDVADTLDWLADPGDPNENYQAPASATTMEAQPSVSDIEKMDAVAAAAAVAASDLTVEPEMTSKPEDQTVAPAPACDSNALVGTMPEMDPVKMENEAVDQQLPSIFDGAPEESTGHLPDDKGMAPSTSAVDLIEAASHGAMDEPLFDTPMEEHDFVSTILENESTADLAALH